MIFNLFLSSLLTLLLAFLAPEINLLPYAPFFCFYLHPDLLKIAFGAGLFLDFLTSSDRLGAHAIALPLALLCCLAIRRRVSEGLTYTYPLLTILFSSLVRLIANPLALFDGEWILINLLLWPLADGFCAQLISLFCGTMKDHNNLSQNNDPPQWKSASRGDGRRP
jgi:hypothetical protein